MFCWAGSTMGMINEPEMKYGACNSAHVKRFRSARQEMSLQLPADSGVGLGERVCMTCQ